MLFVTLIHPTPNFVALLLTILHVDEIQLKNPGKYKITFMKELRVG